ncbi:MAG: hypothetical protein ACI4R9_05105 [Kiritimatiellia bacterium]
MIEVKISVDTSKDGRLVPAMQRKVVRYVQEAVEEAITKASSPK